MSAKNKEIMAALPYVIGAVGVGLVIYAVVHGVDKLKDLFGKGEEGKKATGKQIEFEELSPENNPFTPAYLKKLQKDMAGTKTPIHYLTGANKVYLYNQISSKLSLSQTYIHPWKYKENRERVLNDFKKIIKRKSELSDLATYFASKGKDLFKIITDGYRDTGWTSGSDYEKMYTDLLTYVKNLPNY